MDWNQVTWYVVPSTPWGHDGRLQSICTSLLTKYPFCQFPIASLKHPWRGFLGTFWLSNSLSSYHKKTKIENKKQKNFTTNNIANPTYFGLSDLHFLLPFDSLYGDAIS